MIVRELLVSLGFDYNQTKAKQAEKDIKNIKTGYKDVEIGSTRAADMASRNFDRMSRKARQSESEIARIGDTLESWGNRLNALAAVAASRGHTRRSLA